MTSREYIAEAVISMALLIALITVFPDLPFIVAVAIAVLAGLVLVRGTAPLRRQSGSRETE